MITLLPDFSDSCKRPRLFQVLKADWCNYLRYCSIFDTVLIKIKLKINFILMKNYIPMMSRRHMGRLVHSLVHFGRGSSLLTRLPSWCWSSISASSHRTHRPAKKKRNTPLLIWMGLSFINIYNNELMKHFYYFIAEVSIWQMITEH